MAYQYTDYSGYGNESEEETRKRRAMMIASAMAGLPAGAGPADVAGQVINDRIAQAQNTATQAGQMFTNPEEAMQKRLQLDRQEQVAADATPVTQTIKTNPVTGEQEMTVKGNVRDLSAANPLTPTVSGFQSQPISPDSLQMQQAQVPVPQQQMPQLPAQGQIPADMAQRPVPAMQLPPIGAGVNVASNAPGLPQTQPPVQQPPAAVAAAPGASLAQMSQRATPTVERQIEPPSQQNINQDLVINARNEQDPIKRRQEFAKILTSDTVDEGTKMLANRFIADDYIKQRNIADAERKIEQATETDLARYMRETKKEGSYVKAILFARLGLNELAQKEQEKLDPTITMASAVDSEGKKYAVGRDKNGRITVGFDSMGKQIGQEAIANLSAAALPTKSAFLPQSAGGLMQKTIMGPDGQPQVITGQVFTDPQTNTTYFQAGNKRYDTSGLSTPAQNIQNVYGAAQAGAAGKAGGEGFVVPPLSPFPGMQGQPQAGVQPPAQQPMPQGPVNPQVVDRAQRDIQSLQNEINRIPANDPKREERLRILNSEVSKAQGVIGQGAPQVTQPLWKQRQNAELAETQAKANIELNKEVAAAEQKVPAAERGKQQAKDIAKQGFADSTYPLLSAVREEISKSTGSKLGAGVDELARVIGASTKGAEAIAKLEVLAGPIKMNIPRFEGAQSDRDVAEYARQAGDFANPKLPIKTRLAALEAMETLLSKYDKAGTNDWTFGRTTEKAKETGTTSSGNKYKRVQ